MKTEEIRIEIKEINRRDIFIEIPAVSKKKLDNFITKNTAFSYYDNDVLNEILRKVSFVERALRVCLRKPDDFDLTGNCYFRVWDFNEALFGETLYAWHVVQLCFALEKMGKKEFKLLLSDHCGGKISVISPYVEAGKHSYAMEILVDKSKPRLYLNCTSGGWGGIYFNPQSYYAVIPKE